MTTAPTESEPLYSSLGSDPDLGEIVEMFVAEMPDRMAALTTQLDAADWEGLRRSAHQLKGAAGSHGFDSISPSAARLEDALLESQPEEQIRRAVEELADLCSRIRSGAPA
jgi:HPt (histidine-containing phosphotransfer) domain-containing protein